MVRTNPVARFLGLGALLGRLQVDGRIGDGFDTVFVADGKAQPAWLFA